MARVTVASLQARIAELEAQLAATTVAAPRLQVKTVTVGNTTMVYDQVDARGRAFRWVSPNVKGFAPTVRG